MASRQTDRDIGIRVAPNLIFSYPAGAGFSRIWNCKSGQGQGRGRIFFTGRPTSTWYR